jgi:drug/metabolite transporter (DMT)-like permease
MSGLLSGLNPGKPPALPRTLWTGKGRGFALVFGQMSSQPPSHARAVLSGLLVTFLWSTSFVIIKWGLRASFPPLTFAGLRYFLAFVCLAPFVLLSGKRRRALLALPGWAWRRLLLLGIVYYTLAQGLQFIGLDYLPAATVSLILNLTPLTVAFLGCFTLGEWPGRMQWTGVAMSLFGALVYFFPLTLPAGAGVGIVIVFLSMCANAGAAILGRHINKSDRMDPLLVTFISMGLGSFLLLSGGLASQGLGHLTPQDWALVAWLAVVNTAIAFTLWNRTLRTLSAVESSVLNSTMLPQIAILAWLFLGEDLDLRRCLGLAVAVAGIFAVQWGRRPVKP